ncbi:TVP38/TMEM64 family protein [Meiothermus sp.]|uniref:TVP38/TMEM64 family protein n=1 Tax=Meiothermus sp. TaxID=1955249 RepID=UPI0021DCFC6E|nr:VTT domain-containing protein [Meiothermus sp.]GIW32722.1 MAG: hypothetical protein KatS3mg072_0055 [Meiothermus sp.]
MERLSASRPLPILPVFLTLLLLASALVGAYFVFPGFKERMDGVYGLLSGGNPQVLQAWVAGLGFWGPLSIIGLMIAQTLVSVVPMTLVMLISVLAFGPVVGGVLGWVGAIIAAMLGYSLARLLGPVVVDRFVSEKIRLKVEEQVERYGPWAIIALRLSFVVPTDSVNFVAGLVRMHPLKFLLATSVGAAPVAVVVAWLGADFSCLGPFLLVATLVGLTALGGFIFYDQSRLRRKNKAGKGESV